MSGDRRHELPGPSRKSTCGGAAACPTLALRAAAGRRQTEELQGRAGVSCSGLHGRERGWWPVEEARRQVRPLNCRPANTPPPPPCRRYAPTNARWCGAGCGRPASTTRQAWRERLSGDLSTGRSAARAAAQSSSRVAGGRGFVALVFQNFRFCGKLGDCFLLPCRLPAARRKIFPRPER